MPLYDSPRILIIDDQEDNVLLLKRLLNASGYGAVVTVQDSRNAIESFHSFQPQIVFLDIEMPYLDGFEILSGIRSSSEELNSVPIVVTSADTSDEVRALSLKQGATELYQSFLIQDLLEIVVRLAGRPTGNQIEP